ncbi:hypothetical protein MP638_003111, partial [Amoeboaphelidium occidentale]
NGLGTLKARTGIQRVMIKMHNYFLFYKDKLSKLSNASCRNNNIPTPGCGKVVLKFARFSHESSCYLRNEIDVLKKLYDAGYSSGVKYLDSEIIESHELCVLITLFCGKRIGGLRDINFQEWLKYSEGLCKAVAELHQHGFIHCDLSCNNVCLLKNEVKIIDFGLLVYCDSDGKSLNKIRT